VSAAEALAAAAEAGVRLGLDSQGRLVAEPAGRLPAEVREVVRSHKNGLKAALRLRTLHRSLGLAEDDIRLIEAALLSGQVAEVRIVTAPPSSVQ
jgi:hypothetical protein